MAAERLRSLASIRSSPAWLGLLFALGCRDVTPGTQLPATLATRAPAPSSLSAAPRAAHVRGGHGQGVPLHRVPESSAVSARLPNGARVIVLDTNGRWVRVRAEDGTEGWLVPRYLADGPPVTASAAVERAHSPWTSADACDRVLGAARPPRSAGRARIGTWNLRWFPDGVPGERAPSGGGTDIAWLACSLAWLELDVVAVQEIKSNQRARAKLDELVAELSRRSGGNWRARLDDCDSANGQHVGLLYDATRVLARDWHTYATLNPSGGACKNQLRPGFGAYFRFPGGLDLHVISVHNKSGSHRRDLDLRASTLGGLGQAEAEAEAAMADRDLVFAGDFNTMGCRHCAPPVTSESELEALGQKIRELAVPLERLVADATCTEFSSEGRELLDHVLVSQGLTGLVRGREAHVGGLCELERCTAQPRSTPAAWVERLSDHCPVVIELVDRDLD